MTYDDNYELTEKDNYDRVTITHQPPSEPIERSGLVRVDGPSPLYASDLEYLEFSKLVSQEN